VIILSWFQTFFQKFKKDEDFTYEDDYKEIDYPSYQRESTKDVEARISYQYPKSDYRPLSEKSNQVKRVSRKRRESNVEQDKMESTEVKAKEKTVPKTLKVKTPKKSGPFHPTEIPSPIFGFNRPKKSEIVIEHELTHFFKEEEQDQLQLKENAPSDLVETVPLESNDVVQVYTYHPEINSNDSVIVQEKTEQPNIRKMDSTSNVSDESVKNVKMEQSIIEHADNTKPKLVDEVPAIVRKQQAERNENWGDGEVASSEQPPNPIAKRSSLPLESNDVVQVHTYHPETNSNDSEIVQEVTEQPHSRKIDSVSIVTDEPVKEIKMEQLIMEEADHTERKLVDEVPAIVRKQQVEGTVNRADGEIVPSEQSPKPKPKRSRLPFNVLMLKQDREKWEARQKRNREESKRELLLPGKEEKQAEPYIETKPPFIDEDNEKKESLAQPRHEQINESSGQLEKDTIGMSHYVFPNPNLLHPPVSNVKDTQWLLQQEEMLNRTLQNFNVGARVVNVTQGPSVTRFEVQPEPGVKVNKITNLSDDIKLSLAARDIRIEAPIPGKHTIGIEVPNQHSRPVRISELILSDVFQQSASPLTTVLGLDIEGKPIVTDLKKMPHGLIAGATGSGKSVCINSILVSLLFKAAPHDLKLLLIDPKMVELAPYNRIPHLVSPVITDVKAATAALKWAVEEMERRYELFAHTGVREINRYNELAIEQKRYSDKLPYIVIVIDELADLMMMSPADVEEAICRIAQKARACGIHLIIATQRPSVDVITGLIKANIPTRIAFSVSSQVDSRTIIDISGAEKLLGRGDMLFLENGTSKPVRLQGTFVTDEEIDAVVDHVRREQEPDYLFVQEELIKKAQITEEEDELFYSVCEFIIEQGGASTSSLQRRFKIGYNRAARLMDMLEQYGFISSANGSKPREVLITEADLEQLLESGVHS
jgi:DNA segregation ATPase FtsK/SpoIIIE, S-DNA-T family